MEKHNTQKELEAWEAYDGARRAFDEIRIAYVELGTTYLETKKAWEKLKENEKNKNQK